MQSVQTIFQLQLTEQSCSLYGIKRRSVNGDPCAAGCLCGLHLLLSLAERLLVACDVIDIIIDHHVQALRPTALAASVSLIASVLRRRMQRHLHVPRMTSKQATVLYDYCTWRRLFMML